MKKRRWLIIAGILGCILLSACGTDGSTTMDQGKDTDGMAGEQNEMNAPITQGTSGENGEGSQQAAENVTGGAENAINNVENAAEDVAEGAGNAVKDVTEGAGRAVNDVVNGAEDAMQSAVGN